MAELPPVPSMNPNAPDEPPKVVPPPTVPPPTVPPPSALPPSASPPSAPPPGAPPPTDGDTAPGDQSAEPAVPQPQGQEDPASALEPAQADRQLRKRATTQTHVNEFLDEVLEQASSQMLRLSSIEEALGSMQQTVQDLHEEMVAGLIETRSAAQESAGGAFHSAGPDERWQRSFAEKVDQAEFQTRQALKGQGLLVVLMVLQLLLVAAIAYRTFSSRAADDSGQTPKAPAAAQSDSGTGADGMHVKPPGSKKVRKRRRKTR